MSNPKPLQPENIPDELKNSPQWVLWRSEARAGQDKPTKVPYEPTGQNASHSDPSTWSSFDKAIAAYETGRFDGIGFVFSYYDPYTGIDLDDCVDGSGHLTEEARQLVEHLDSYTEWSVSNTGVHIILKGELPEGGRRTSEVAGMSGIEMYDRLRFFVCTGRLWRGRKQA